MGGFVITFQMQISRGVSKHSTEGFARAASLPLMHNIVTLRGAGSDSLIVLFIYVFQTQSRGATAVPISPSVPLPAAAQLNVLI